MSKKVDNTERYKRFSEAYKRAYKNVKAEDRKKAIDAEWRDKWKPNVQDDEKFERRILHLCTKSKATSIFHSFNKSKPGWLYN